MKENASKAPLLKYLEEKGVTSKHLIDTALELFVPHPCVETKEKAAEILRVEFLDALSDVNVSCLEVARFRAEDQLYSRHGLEHVNLWERCVILLAYYAASTRLQRNAADPIPIAVSSMG